LKKTGKITCSIHNIYLDIVVGSNCIVWS